MMILTMTFQKEDSGWFAVIPTWEGPHGALAMVAGADTLLDRLANNKSEVTLLVSNEWFKTIDFAIVKTSVGGDYIVADAKLEFKKLKEHKLWLCSVLQFIFEYYPETIYVQVLNIDDITTPVEHKTTIKGWFKWFWSYFKMKIL